jgi:chemotaxis protein MotB
MPKEDIRMKKQLRFGFIILAVMIIASGCVSTGTFEKMQADKNGEIAALQKSRADLETQKKGLEEQKGKLEQDNAAMKQQNAALDQKNKAAEQEKAALLAANQQRQQQYDSLVQGLSKEVEKGQLQVRQFKNMLAVDLAEKIFFDSGKAMIKKEGKDVLQKVADALKGYENKIIRVVGHTDNVPLAKSASFPSN